MCEIQLSLPRRLLSVRAIASRGATWRYRDHVEVEVNRLAALVVCTQLERGY
jgi:hypothetical protein